ncbi:MAG: hypothetical protein OMM_04496 [Candidatus Magnetoglobus multicellularis str. Araruama]|uniref:Ketoreductase domain-containing protein n=1 Tax=Candidatus Magnetoglobus multicellularis str. Araruama TaxID=890399 RepID=A0A1V1P109_9BACT|nr:MAG: hypothetical protein OMM_04496 [Candidatus Magnetoglobus multicellularis str. Araruama]
MVSPIRFLQGIESLTQNPRMIFLEIGAGRDLTLMTRRVFQDSLQQKSLSLIPPENWDDTDDHYFLHQLGRIWLHGHNLKWKKLYARNQNRKIPLPTYSFQHDSYWPETNVYQTINEIKTNLNTEKRIKITDWGFTFSWERTGITNTELSTVSRRTILIFMDDCGVGCHFDNLLSGKGYDVIKIFKGLDFSPRSKNEFQINPKLADDYNRLLSHLTQFNLLPQKILHLWNITQQSNNNRWDTFVESQYDGYFSMQFIARAIGKQNLTSQFSFFVFNNNLQTINDNERIRLEKSTLLGAIKVIPKEYPNISCRNIDISNSYLTKFNEKDYCRLLHELELENIHQEIAYRGSFRWVKKVIKIPLPKSDLPLIKPGATYLLTGGLGGMGLVLARFIAEHAPVKLLLTGRSFFPLKKDWDPWVQKQGADDSISQKILKLKEIENLGSTVVTIQADCADLNAMETIIKKYRIGIDVIKGIIHAAGIADGKFIQRRDDQDCLKIMLPKIKGLYVLNQLFSFSKLDFVVICSSIASVIPSVGQIAYCAANIFFDNFAVENALGKHVNVKSISWDMWKDVGMGVRTLEELKEQRVAGLFIKHREAAIKKGSLIRKQLKFSNER